MWRFKGFEGAKEPEEKKRKVDKQPQDTRQWTTKWLIDDSGNQRKWLTFSKEKNLMFCAVCTDKKNAFVVGTDNFKLSAVKCHEMSKPHGMASLAQTSKETGTSPAANMLHDLTEAEISRLDKLFQSAHAIGKKAVPFISFEWMCR